MPFPFGRAAFATMLAVFLYAPAFAQAPMKTIVVELEAEKDYFAPGNVRVIALSKSAGEVSVGELDVTIRRRREISVPADTREIAFRTEKGISARSKIPASGTIVVRPLSSAGSVSGIAWMLGRRGGIAVEKLAIELKRE
jgi:hypothetical protein